ncbi:UTP--glucose-1-phosphate uridylyltransferase GalU [Paenibacillus sp. KQZ6P-2]|uniref:UTP--glucose-1-phosphate uridylyltransferase n=1 Tax=Paenibacillus mangrovi TaxID=2931978 RepID=A0A9X1WM13_9BACL|nr:UTP--glucose-1-phosphate uridylyltransferase GalU [Paenibacillus mangrovi]MCJ8010961.1 UTP--glucose-1-phosphate uridylyltransferase GalU [Paenibacillus mangrovi]
MKTVRKAVIPAAGLGTRFLPITKAVPKELLPIINKPAIHYIVEEAVASGIEDVIIITGRDKRAIEDYFDHQPQIEQVLKKKGDIRVLQWMDEISNMANFQYIRQNKPLGLGHAVWTARKAVGQETFAVMLGDMIFHSQKPCLQQLIESYHQQPATVIGVQPVAPPDIEKYGILDGEKVNDRLYRIKSLVEKPKGNPPSNLAIMGRYILEPQIMDELAILPPPKLGEEIQLTDALRNLSEKTTCYALECEGISYDIGNLMGLIKANVEYAQRHELLKKEMHGYLQGILKPEKEGEEA